MSAALLLVVAATFSVSSAVLERATDRCNARLTELQRKALPELRVFGSGHNEVSWWVQDLDADLEPSPFIDDLSVSVVPRRNAGPPSAPQIEVARPGSPANAPWRDSGLEQAPHFMQRYFVFETRAWVASVVLHNHVDRFTRVLPRLFAVLEQCAHDFPSPDQAESKQATP